MPPDSPDAWPIRAARPDDAIAIASVQRSAILGGAKDRYSAAQIRAWIGEITPQAQAEAIDHLSVRVALDDGAVCGFTSISIADSRIGALYVAQFAMHRGVGRALLIDAEELLRAADRREVLLDATLGSVDFYRWLGYADIGEVSRRIGSTGVALAAVAMRKQLG